jgi:hypothetical protein
VHERRELPQRQRLAVDIADIEIDDVRGMQMRIDEAGDDEAPVRVLDARLRADVRLGALGTADIEDPIAAGRDGLAVARASPR